MSESEFAVPVLEPGFEFVFGVDGEEEEDGDFDVDFGDDSNLDPDWS